MRKVLFLLGFAQLFTFTTSYIDEIEEKLPTKCHVCKHMTKELAEELSRSDKSNDVLYMGQVFQKEPKKIPYKQSELRLTEALENACSNVLEYKVHKDKPLHLRYGKVESMTFKTLRGLKDRGVKVDLGFPDELWNTPDAEITRLKSKCEQMVEEYEDDISHWYWYKTDANLTHWLCINRILKPGEDDCFKKTEFEEGKTSRMGDKQENQRKSISQNTGSRGDWVSSTDYVQEKRNKNNENGIHRDKHRNKVKIKKFRSHLLHDHYRLIDEWQRSNGFSITKQKALRDRLRSISDPDRLLREIRKIRNKELKNYEYYPMKPWGRKLDNDIPRDTRWNGLRRHVYGHLEDVDDFQREIENRAISLKNYYDELDNRTIHEIVRRYLDDIKAIRDMKELRMRLEDLDALSVIIGNQTIHDEL